MTMSTNLPGFSNSFCSPPHEIKNPATPEKNKRAKTRTHHCSKHLLEARKGKRLAKNKGNRGQRTGIYPFAMHQLEWTELDWTGLENPKHREKDRVWVWIYPGFGCPKDHHIVTRREGKVE